jgi:hypothetical protein
MVVITGINEIISKINKIQHNIQSLNVTNAGLEPLRDGSISYLKSISYSPITDDSIRNINNWSINQAGPLSSVLSCNSPHSALIEFGSGDVWARYYLGTSIANSNIRQEMLDKIKAKWEGAILG